MTLDTWRTISYLAKTIEDLDTLNKDLKRENECLKEEIREYNLQEEMRYERNHRE